MKEAIIRSVQAGYKKDWMSQHDTPQLLAEYIMDSNDFLLDPLFWQALGKAEGWSDIPSDFYHCDTHWQFQWHSFIDHLASGKDVDSFFTNLLAKK